MKASMMKFLCGITLVFTLASGLMPLSLTAVGAQEPPAARADVKASDVDSDGDGLTDYAEIHKYHTDPHKRSTAGDGTSDGDWQRRGEYAYSIAYTMQIAKPCNPADMTDDYQDCRVLYEDNDSYIVEIVAYPLNSNREAIGENAHWQTDDGGMTEYLKPTPTENWDAAMRADLLADLKKAGIEPDKLTDKQVVEQVSRWAMNRSHDTKAFAVWDVYFPDGKPAIYPPLQAAFEAEKPAPSWTTQQMLDQEVLGKGMYYNKVHGSCTSSSIYLSTIFRALGIPTRIIFCIPPADANDTQQYETLYAGIHHHQVLATLRNYLPTQGFSNHLFNEVFVGGRWVRLNYANLGQNSLDSYFFGLLTHIYTTSDISKVPLAATWGMRYRRYADVQPRLSSTNPYRLLTCSDHFGKFATIDNPEVVTPELKTVTIVGLYSKDDARLPTWARDGLKDLSVDFMIAIGEHVAGNRHQMRDFEARAGNDFLLQAPGHPDVRVSLTGLRQDTGQGDYQAFGARIMKADRAKFVPGVAYTIKPLNTNAIYRWQADAGVTLSGKARLGTEGQ